MQNGERGTLTVWALRMLQWDGALPVTMLLVPWLVQLVFPNRNMPIALLAVALPIAGLFVRFYVGCCHITANHCARWFRRLQSTVLVLGLVVLMVAESLVISVQDIVGNPMFWRDPNETKILVLHYGIYLVCMALALYPGVSRAKGQSRPDSSLPLS